MTNKVRAQQTRSAGLAEKRTEVTGQTDDSVLSGSVVSVVFSAIQREPRYQQCRVGMEDNLWQHLQTVLSEDRMEQTTQIDDSVLSGSESGLGDVLKK
ncbi:hypothetical protein ACOMHN_014520 [Nucella lapillus]